MEIIAPVFGLKRVIFSLERDDMPETKGTTEAVHFLESSRLDSFVTALEEDKIQIDSFRFFLGNYSITGNDPPVDHVRSSGSLYIFTTEWRIKNTGAEGFYFHTTQETTYELTTILPRLAARYHNIDPEKSAMLSKLADWAYRGLYSIEQYKNGLGVTPHEPARERLRAWVLAGYRAPLQP